MKLPELDGRRTKFVAFTIIYFIVGLAFGKVSTTIWNKVTEKPEVVYQEKLVPNQEYVDSINQLNTKVDSLNTEIQELKK